MYVRAYMGKTITCFKQIAPLGKPLNMAFWGRCYAMGVPLPEPHPCPPKGQRAKANCVPLVS